MFPGEQCDEEESTCEGTYLHSEVRYLPYSVATLVAVLTFYFSTVAVSVIPRQIIEPAVFIVRMSIPTRMRVFLRAG